MISYRSCHLHPSAISQSLVLSLVLPLAQHMQPHLEAWCWSLVVLRLSLNPSLSSPGQPAVPVVVAIDAC